MKISILDYGLLDEGMSPSQALHQTVRLAQEADQLGYHRFWVAEHHNVHALTISNPELMMMYLLQHTKTIRIGSGGIMALHYSELKLAETIRTLSAFFPDRVDIGFGNSLGTALVHQSLKSVHSSDDYRACLQKCLAYLDDSDTTLPLAHPQVPMTPPMWLLSMGEKSAILAGELGLGYVYGIFPYVAQSPLVVGKTAAERYRQAFSESSPHRRSHMILAVFVAIAETEDLAEGLAKSLDVWFLGRDEFNEFKAFPSVTTALSYVSSETDKRQMADNRQRFFVGTPQQIQSQLQPFIEAICPDEILFIPLVSGIDNRIASLHLLKQLELS